MEEKSVDDAWCPEASLTVRMNTVGKQVLLVNNNEAFEINEVGAFLWRLCDAEHSVGQLIIRVTEEYDVTARKAHAQVWDFLNSLRECRLLED